MSENEMRKPFAGAEVVFNYTRAQAIEDGVLIDVTETAKEAGFKVPTAISLNVYEEVVLPPALAAEQGESEAGRLWDVLWMCSLAVRQANRRPDRDEVRFKVIATDAEGEKAVHRLYVKSHGGDNGEHVLTVMCEGED